MKVEMENNLAHGKYELYLKGKIIEKGMYRRGKKYFHSRFNGNKITEYGCEVYFYGQIKDNQPVQETEEKHPMIRFFTV